MKGISEKFTEEEFKLLKDEKDKDDKSWHDFIFDVKKLKDESVVLKEENSILKEEIRNSMEKNKFLTEENIRLTEILEEKGKGILSSISNKIKRG